MYYQLRGVDVLPTIDLQLTLKSVWLASNPSTLKRLNALIHGTKTLFRYLTFLSGLVQTIALLVNAHLGEQLMYSTLASFLPLFFGIVSMRYHMIQIVMSTYEFWYLVIICTLYGIIGTIQLGNGRCIGIIMMSCSSIYLIMIDANHKSGKEVILMGLFYASVQCLGIILVSLHLIDQFGSFRMLHRQQWVLMSDDVMINCLATLMIMALRTSYRRWEHYKMAINGKNTVRCVVYRARLQFVESSKHRKTSRPSATGMNVVPCQRNLYNLGTTTLKLATPKRIQLMIIPQMETIDPNNMMMMSSIEPYSKPLQRIFQCVMIGGVTTSLFSLFCFEMETKVETHGWSILLVSLSFFLTFLTCLTCHFYRHRTILRKLTASFDFLFLSFQVISATILLIFLFHGDTRSLIVLSSLFWMLWIMTLDTLTPVIKTKFGITPYLIMYVMIMVTISQFYLFFRILSNVQDRTIVHFVLKTGHVIQWRAIGFFFSRMFTVCAWCLRLLYRVQGLLKPEHSNTLIMLYGPVEYEDAVWMQTRRVVPETFHSFDSRKMKAPPALMR